VNPEPRWIAAVFAGIALSVLAGCDRRPALASADGIRVESGYGYPAAGDVAAAYVRISARPGHGDTLLSVSGSAFRHGMIMTTTAGRMKGVTALAIPAGETLEMRPGAVHLMLEGVDSALAAGDSLRLVLGFARVGEISILLPVVPYGLMPE
jgi:hypothetical protein